MGKYILNFSVGVAFEQMAGPCQNHVSQNRAFRRKFVGCLWDSVPKRPLCKCDLRLGQTSQVSEMSVVYGPGTAKSLWLEYHSLVRSRWSPGWGGGHSYYGVDTDVRLQRPPIFSATVTQLPHIFADCLCCHLKTPHFVVKGGLFDRCHPKTPYFLHSATTGSYFLF